MKLATTLPAISTRLLVGTAIVLAVFVLLMGLSLSWSVHQRAEAARFDRMQGLVYGILGATELVDQERLVVSFAELPDRRLTRNTNGLYAELIANGGERLWQSRSMVDHIPDTSITPIGEWLFEEVESPLGSRQHRLQLSAAWSLDNGEELPFIVQVVDEADALLGQLRRFDQTLWASLLGSAILLLMVQLVVLRYSLRPLRQIGDEVDQIETGNREQLSESVPSELQPLARSINTLLQHERNRHARYRHGLDDLAHSLKTPLSVLSNHAKQGNQEDPVLIEQTRAIQQSIERHLERSLLRSPRYLASPVYPHAIVERLQISLSRLYQDRSLTFVNDIDPDFTLRMDETDLFEMLGNVLDNACKYGAERIEIKAGTEPACLVVEDDGPGFPDAERERLMRRGTRADQKIEGAGIGLASVAELLTLAGGELQLEQSSLGGAQVVLRFA